MTGDGRLHFAVLGSFRVDRDGLEVDPGPRLQRMLLAILVVEARHVVPVDRLIGLLWRDEPPAAAIASVQAYVSGLRRLLEPGRPARAPARVLVTQDPGYVLRLDDDQVDALRFQALARQARTDLAGSQPTVAATRLEDALALWRGDPLPEFAGEPWALPVVAGLTEARDLAAEDRIDAWLALGGHAQAAAELEAMVAACPLRERRWAQLVVAAYRCGRQGDALRAYQRCRAVLAAELGLEPGPELRRLETAVLAQDPSLDWQPAAAPAGAVPPAATPRAAPPLPPPQPEPDPPAPSLVGRDRELAYLRGRLRQVGSGHGGAVVLAGEPGAGKTTLAEAVARLAAAGGITTAWGRCPDAASTPAYWPWSQVLHALPAGPRVRAARQRLDGDLAGDEEESVRQFRAYQAVAAALGEAAAGAPLLAVIDDLHAADEASLALVQLLAGDLHRMPALFLFTVRSTEPSARVGQALGELARHPGAERVAVSAFAAADVAALVERLTAQPPQAEVVSVLMDRTGGNPFYVTELVRLIGSEHLLSPPTAEEVRAVDVPSGIRDVLLRRVGRLPDDTQSLLVVAAVAGRDIQPELLERVAGVDTEHLLIDLEPAVAAGLVAPAEAGWGFRFRHPLIHESLYACAGRVERARLHARIGSALEALSSVSSAADVARLAHHYLSAGPFGDPAKAVRYAREAADRAVRQGAWQDAARHLEQALSAISPAGPDAEAVRCDVLVELGQARRSGGLIRESHSAFEESISLADRIGDEDRVLAAAVAFGSPSLWGSREWGETDTRLVALLEQQLHRIADTDPARRVRIMSTLATELSFGETADRGWAYAREALDAARRLGQPGEMGIAVSSYLRAALSSDHLGERRALAEEMIAGEPGFTPLVQAVLYANLLTERIRFGELARFDAEFPQVWRLASDALHSPELQGQLRFAQACRYIVAGEVERGAEIAQRTFQAMANVTVVWHQPASFVNESSQLLSTGTLADHAEELAARVARPDHPSVPHLAAPAAALGFVLRAEVERARQIVSQWFAPPPRSWTWLQAVAYWAQVATALGVPDPRWLYGRLVPHSGELAVVGVGADCGGAVDSLLAGLAWRLGRLDEAAARAQAGLALETRVGSTRWIIRTKDLAERITAAPTPV
jgi:DNA-binding SARP family transcriptional activator